RSCTGSTAVATSPRARGTICRGTPAPVPSGSATDRSTSARTTCSAPCSTRSFCTRAGANGCRDDSGRSSRPGDHRAEGMARARPGHLRGARRAAALRVVEADVLVAMDRAANLAGIRGDKGLEASWRTTADEIQADILKNGVNDKGVLKQHYATDDWLDASVLLTERPGLGHQHDRGRITL